jgi:ubiquinone/menaquinone biosynthesis C-methylase UbiE
MTFPSPSHTSADNHHSHEVYEALEFEYRAMASWYDSFWADYLSQTFTLPLRLVQMGIWQKQNTVVVVDVGCGTGEFLRRLQGTLLEDEDETKTVQCHGIEPSPEMLEQARTKSTSVNWSQAAAESIPLEDASADMVCSTNSFHFFRDKPVALQQMHRILKSTPISNGSESPSLVITDWCADFLLVRLYHFLERLKWNSWHGLTYPGPLTSIKLQRLVENAGFTNVKVETYRVRLFICFWWGMQTVTAHKE